MNNYNLKGRVAVVTGGAQGFGYAITKRLLESGAEVIIWDIDQKAMDEALKKLSSDKCSYQNVDVTNIDDITKNIENITKEKNIDIFINNAGMAGQNTQVWNYPKDEWLKVMDLDLNSVFYCCKAIVPHMIKNNYGRIVNISSIAGKEGNPNASAYSAAKAASHNLMGHINSELNDLGIRACTIFPAEVDTPILNNRPLPPSSNERASMMQPKDIAQAILLCASMPQRTVVEEIVLKPTKKRDVSADLYAAATKQK
mgnify:CR=1 FL=1